jgi:hypothetical protein
MQVPRDALQVAALPMPPMPHFATLPPLLGVRMSTRLFGQEGKEIVAGLPFVSFSCLAAVQVR